jgi:hypothetical protein
MRKLLATTALVLAMAAPAQADVILGGQNWTFSGADNLTFQSVVPGGNQPQNIQCIICGENQPQQQANFGYTDFKNSGSLTGINMFSTNVSGGANPGDNVIGLGYDGAFLRAYLVAKGDTNLQFSVGIDINDSNQTQTLNSFFMLNLTQHTVLAAFRPAGGQLVPDVNNGTGFPDYTLSGFNINIGTDIQAGDQIIFFARMSNMNDGPDSFFIEPIVTAVPGPVVGAGFPGIVAGCIGLWGLAMKRRRRQGLIA